MWVQIPPSAQEKRNFRKDLTFIRELVIFIDALRRVPLSAGGWILNPLRRVRLPYALQRGRTRTIILPKKKTRPNKTYHVFLQE